jgi:cytochrome P450
MPVIPAELDPPRHSKLRKLVLPNFTEKALQPWVPGVQKIIADAFAPLLPLGKADIVVDIARPVPVLAICLVLGIDRDWRRIRQLAEDFLAATGKQEARAKAAEQKTLEVQARFEQLRKQLQTETDETRQRLNRAADERSKSVSSMRRIRVPPKWRAKSQLNKAVRAPPTCKYPVGEGAKRTRGVEAVSDIFKLRVTLDATGNGRSGTSERS